MSKQGFAAMSPERVREIAAMGGRAVPANKRAFSTNLELAVSAGTKGGKALPAERRTFARVPGLASRAAKIAAANR